MHVASGPSAEDPLLTEWQPSMSSTPPHHEQPIVHCQQSFTLPAGRLHVTSTHKKSTTSSSERQYAHFFPTPTKLQAPAQPVTCCVSCRWCRRVMSGLLCYQNATARTKGHERFWMLGSRAQLVRVLPAGCRHTYRHWRRPSVQPVKSYVR